MNASSVEKKRERIIILLVLVSVALSGVTIRALNLGGPDINEDEAWHIFAARGLQETGSPELPSGYVYSRGLIYTKLVLWSTSLFGDGEAAARIPSVFFGLLEIILVYLFGRILFTPLAGLFAAFMLAFSPLDVSWSREIRFYTMFSTFFLLFSMLLYIALSKFETFLRTEEKPFFKSAIAYFLLSLVVFFFAVKLHVLALVGATGILAYILLRGFIPLGEERRVRVWYRNGSYILALLGVLALILGKDFLWPYVEKALYFAPKWAEGAVDNWRYYIYVFLTEYPVIFGSVLLSALWWISSRPRPVLYLLCVFSVPLLLHSFLFAWKNERYILYLLPFLFILSGAGLAALSQGIFNHAEAFLREHNIVTNNRANSLVSMSLAAISVAFFIAATPWFSNSLKIHKENVGGYGVHQNWKNVSDYILENSGRNESVVASVPLIMHYYGMEKERLYFMNNYASDPIQEIDIRDENGVLLDYGLGVPVIMDLEDFKGVESTHPCLWVVVDRKRFLHHPDAIPVEIREYIQSKYQLHELENAPDMVVWSHREAGGTCMNASG